VIWFTVQLDDRPGALARLTAALADRSVNIGGIVGIAEDTGGELMLQTSDSAATREAFDALGLEFEEHDSDGSVEPGGMSVNDVRRGRDERGRDERGRDGPGQEPHTGA
jgi:hypothetical protein